jgi:putative hydrolase of the HAD superfamily
MKHKVILFDLGDVILPISVEETFSYWSRVSGIPVETVRDKMLFDKETYLAFERGEVPPGRFRREVSELLGYHFPKKEFDEGWNRMIGDALPETQALLEALSKKYRLAALSNTNLIHERYFLKKYPRVFSKFEKLFLSHRIGGRKPEETVFRQVLGHFKVLPEEMVFLDDREEHIGAARRIGICCVRVNGVSDLSLKLRQAGVEP